MAEMLVVLFPVPGLVVPGRRRIAAVGEAQLLADRPVDIADIGAGKRDTKLHIGRAEEQLLPRCFGFLEGGPEILLVAGGRENEFYRDRPPLGSRVRTQD